MTGRSMRILFSCTAGEGHYWPLVPLARAAVEHGHDVVFATAEGFAERVVRPRFETLPAGLDEAEVAARHEPYRLQILTMPPGDRRPHTFTTRFAMIEAPAKLAELLGVAAEWAPDLIVHDPADLAAPIVAAALAVPSAQHSFGRLVRIECFERADAETSGLWASQGLAPEPLCGAFRGSYVDICPLALRTESVPAGVPVVELRPASRDPGPDTPAAWRQQLPERRTVYVTLGTRTAYSDLELFRLVLDATSDLDCNVVATIGRRNDPGFLAPLPANAIVERYIPQAEVLAIADAAVTHGGSGSTLGALAYGLPLLLLPQGADQFDNAWACGAVGAARYLMPDEVTPEAVRAGVVALLEDPACRQGAERLAREIAGMPSPDAALSQLIPAVA
jgi:UDP:flavonoid glycosyltransferase YjiC (YdhE family)